jgi:uncharacterized protein (DUF427 family)
MRAILDGITIARSDDTIVVEGNQYFPLDSVAPGALCRSRMKSLCPWKGRASYYQVEAGGAQSPNGAGPYRHPYPWIRKIKSRVAFWNESRSRPTDELARDEDPQPPPFACATPPRSEAMEKVP